jgi:acetyl-CoA carboxylase carboxyltransferase component
MLHAYASCTTPKITIILRKSYGGSYLAMCSQELGADMVFAWPTAEIAVMGSEAAVKILYRKELDEAEDRVARAAELAQERARIEAEAAEIRRRAAALDEEERVRRMQAEAAKMPDLPTERVGEIMRSFAEPQDVTLPRVTVEYDLKVQAEPAAAETPQPPPLVELPATMTVTRINELLAPVSISGDGLQKLGFQRQQRPGPGVHFLGSDWELMKAAIIKHVGSRA